ncbi:hypothetical protein [Candidatus Nitrosopumilus sediminis]|uniref:DUF4352 domain-containing protein n=1 Tax=Candidatus Nitrosopumilus sediminis TaxID=1229909 RepID=K0B9W2_9ARCH|nr:hypothetical protein [Candidatus Nitrosopumilus sediminis]AFS82983.1 hypothetical protein NSED_05905 [Candidatus Nitrosopumilus sediminis]
MRTRRAISPILAVIILMTIATMGGGILFGIQNQILVTGLSKIDLRVVDLRLEKDMSGSCYLQTAFYNSGTELIQKIHLKTTLDDGEDFVREIDNFGGILVPGDTAESFEMIEFSDFQCGNFTTSKTYSVFVNASSNDSKFSTLQTMKVENVTKT